MIPVVDEGGDLVNETDSETTDAVNEVLHAENDWMPANATGDEETQEEVDEVRNDAWDTVSDIAEEETSTDDTGQDVVSDIASGIQSNLTVEQMAIAAGTAAVLAYVGRS
jgi:hypothetical protein